MRKTPDGKPPEVIIAEPADDKAKGRSFTATLFAWVEADGLWEGGSANTEVRRPIYAVLGCSEGATAPIKANLRLGRRCEVDDGDAGNKYSREKAERWEFLKSGGYRFDEQRHVDIGCNALEIKMPSLLRIDGEGMVAKEGAAFVVLPTVDWTLAQRLDDGAVVRYLRSVGCKVPDADLARYLPAMAASGALFAAYLDRRTRCPLPADVRLHAQITVAAITDGLAGINAKVPSFSRETPWGYSRGVGYYEEGTERVGLLPGIAFRASHEVLEPFLAREVQRYLAKVGNCATTAAVKLPDATAKASDGVLAARQKRDAFDKVLAVGASKKVRR